MKHDIAWLADVLKPLERDPRVVDPNTPAYHEAYKEIQRRWRRMDETPKEGEELAMVGVFTMHRYPVLHCWYSAVRPAHKAWVAHYLDNVLFDDGKRRMHIPHPPADHPVIYVSWYDAWAFCQWVRWTDAATGKRYGLRLPHEVEWEYAARWTTQPDGSPRAIAFGQPYWWGSTFYRSGEGVEEPITNEFAHAQGEPGATRAPALAKPNGLGFHDMLGNVWEWMANIYDPSEKKTLEEGTEIQYSRHYPECPAPVNPQRTMRGGLWYYLNLLSTVSNRYRLTGDDGVTRWLSRRPRGMRTAAFTVSRFTLRARTK